jgi:hypothetical protein
MTKKYNQLHYESSSWKKLTVFPNILFTPELAADFLQNNIANRPINNGALRKYVRQIRANQWPFAGDNIKISNTGKLLDGQHRLLAIQETGITKSFNLQTGLSDETFSSMDIGRNRTAGDAIAIKGYKNWNVVASALKIIMSYGTGGLAQKAAGSENKFSNHDLVTYLETKVDKDLLEECATLGNRCYQSAKFFSAGSYAGFLYLFSQYDGQAAREFFDYLTSGENISKSKYSMIYFLREKLIKYITSNSRLQTIDKWALLIKSWNAYRKGKEVAYLAWQSKEDFPTISK